MLHAVHVNVTICILLLSPNRHQNPQRDIPFLPNARGDNVTLIFATQCSAIVHNREIIGGKYQHNHDYDVLCVLSTFIVLIINNYYISTARR